MKEVLSKRVYLPPISESIQMRMEGLLQMNSNGHKKGIVNPSIGDEEDEEEE